MNSIITSPYKRSQDKSMVSIPFIASESVVPNGSVILWKGELTFWNGPTPSTNILGSRVTSYREIMCSIVPLPFHIPSTEYVTYHIPVRRYGCPPFLPLDAIPPAGGGNCGCQGTVPICGCIGTAASCDWHGPTATCEGKTAICEAKISVSAIPGYVPRPA